MEKFNFIHILKKYKANKLREDAVVVQLLVVSDSLHP